VERPSDTFTASFEELQKYLLQEFAMFKEGVDNAGFRQAGGQPVTVGLVQSPYIRLNVGVPYLVISSITPLILLYGTLFASVSTAG
jgi:hypothetical protein